MIASRTYRQPSQRKLYNCSRAISWSVNIYESSVRTWKISLIDPQITPNQSGLTCTKMLITSKNGENAPENESIFAAQAHNLPRCGCCANSIRICFIMTPGSLNCWNACCSFADRLLRNSCIDSSKSAVELGQLAPLRPCVV